MSDRTYTIPNRFGLRAVLLVIAIFAIVFAVTKAVEAELRVVAPVLSFIVLVCLAQMLFGGLPRVASAIVGGLVFPISAYINPMFDGHNRLQSLSWLDLFWFITCGLLAGYLGGVLLAGIFLVADCLRENREKIYVVPRKFGTGTIILATTMFAMLFAVLEWANARPWELFYFTSFIVTVSAAQMFLPRTPRWASVLAGGIFLPLSIMSYSRLGRRWMLSGHDAGSLFQVVVIGLLVGYLGGTLIAGIFLVSDYATRYFSHNRGAMPRVGLIPDEPLEGGTLTMLAERVSARRHKTS